MILEERETKKDKTLDTLLQPISMNGIIIERFRKLLWFALAQGSNMQICDVIQERLLRGSLYC